MMIRNATNQTGLASKEMRRACPLAYAHNIIDSNPVQITTAGTSVSTTFSRTWFPNRNTRLFRPNGRAS